MYMYISMSFSLIDSNVGRNYITIQRAQTYLYDIALFSLESAAKCLNHFVRKTPRSTFFWTLTGFFPQKVVRQVIKLDLP